MRIREAGLGDLDLVCHMRLAFLEERHQVDEALTRGTRAFLERKVAAGTIRSWLAEDDGSCVGIVSMLLLELTAWREDAAPSDAYVINMYVEPTRRRRGIGHALLDECIQAARALRLRRILLHATDDGRSVYLHSGFVTNDAFMEFDPT